MLRRAQNDGRQFNIFDSGQRVRLATAEEKAIRFQTFQVTSTAQRQMEYPRAVHCLTIPLHTPSLSLRGVLARITIKWYPLRHLPVRF